jgi:hypothetical protein
MKRRRRRIDSPAHTWRRATHGEARRRPNYVVGRASGGGRRLGRWAKRASLAEWASLADGPAKGFGPNSRI